MTYGELLVFLIAPVSGLVIGYLLMRHSHREAERFAREHPELKPGHRDLPV